MEYTAVIRTLGKAGEKYQCLLDSLVNQTIKPSRILVYIAEGYAIPKETIGWEEYIYVKKGMVAQRALDYREVETEYILFLDDDVYLPPDGVEYLFNAMKQYDGDVISPDVFNNAGRSTKQEIPLILSGRISVRYKDNTWGYKVMRNGGYSYNKHPHPIMKSQTNAGPCFLCKKNDFEKIRFQEERWLDDMPYALGEDQNYINRVKARWADVYPDLIDVANRVVEERRTANRLSDEYNRKIWKVGNYLDEHWLCGDENMEFDDVMDNLKYCYNKRLENLNNTITNLRKWN